MNSRAEFNRSHIPRLQVEELDEEQIAAQEQKERDDIMKLLQEEDNNWEQSKGKEREQQLREHRKRLGKITEGVKSRKRE